MRPSSSVALILLDIIAGTLGRLDSVCFEAFNIRTGLPLNIRPTLPYFARRQRARFVFPAPRCLSCSKGLSTMRRCNRIQRKSTGGGSTRLHARLVFIPKFTNSNLTGSGLFRSHALRNGFRNHRRRSHYGSFYGVCPYHCLSYYGVSDGNLGNMASKVWTRWHLQTFPPISCPRCKQDASSALYLPHPCLIFGEERRHCCGHRSLPLSVSSCKLRLVAIFR